MHPTLYSLPSKQCCLVYPVAALRSVHKGESGYEPARRDEVILGVCIKVICSVKALQTQPLQMYTVLCLKTRSQAALHCSNNESVWMSHVDLGCQHWMGLRCTFEPEPEELEAKHNPILKWQPVN